MLTLLERFSTKFTINGETGCWEWTAARNARGYGIMRPGKTGPTSGLAHRISYEIHVGEVPAGLQLDHLCRVRHCVNPAHLEPVTNRENGLRGDAGKLQREKTQCKHGHPLSGSNLYVYTVAGVPHRGCVQCRRGAVSRYKAKRRSA